MTWTHFYDMHSGGGPKEDFSSLFIEAPEDEAIRMFASLFGHHPFSIACHCCGENYSITEYPTLEEATAYHRSCAHDGTQYVEEPSLGRMKYGASEKDCRDRYKTLEQYLALPYIRVIRAEELQ